MWTEYYIKDGIVVESYAFGLENGLIRYRTHFFSEMPTEGSYSFEYFFENDIVTENWTFTDVLGNRVTLPVAQDENGYYILDKNRKVIGLQPIRVSRFLTESYVPYYFSSPEDMPATYVSALRALCSAYDCYRKIGLYEEPKAFLAVLGGTDLTAAASNEQDYGANFNYIFDNHAVVSFDTISHELSHAAMSTIAGDMEYRNVSGAIQEAYANILGNLLEMIIYQNDKSIGLVDTEDWLIGETAASLYSDIVVGTSMKNPNEWGNAYQVGGEYYIMDTMPLLTEDSDYESIQGYMEYTHGSDEKRCTGR